jgi:hypothetical protein
MYLSSHMSHRTSLSSFPSRRPLHNYLPAHQAIDSQLPTCDIKSSCFCQQNLPKTLKMEPSPSSVSLVNDIRPRKPIGREIKALVTLLSAPYHPLTAENLQTHNATTSISQTSRHEVTQGRPTAVDTSAMKENHRRAPPERNPAVAASNHSKTKPTVAFPTKTS